MNDVQTLYQEAIRFATYKHLKKRQKVTGTNLPYVVHLSNVAMEILVASQNTSNFNLHFAIQIALLHDTLEDTDTEFNEISGLFGHEVAMAVLALTKNEKLPKGERMADCIYRIKKLDKEVWAVKMADRITNLQKPPASWTSAKRIKYLADALQILDDLREGNLYLANRLDMKMKDYRQYITD